MSSIPSFMELTQNTSMQFPLSSATMPYYTLPPMDFAYSHYPTAHQSEPIDDNRMIEEVAHSLKDFASQCRFQSLPSFPKQSSSLCSRCTKPLAINKRNVMFEGNVLHPECFTCGVCNEPLESNFLELDGKFYCQKDYNRLTANPKAPSELCDFSTVTITTQPANFQVANYNIHPPPSLNIDAPSANNHTVYVSLVEYPTKRVVQEGFQTGDVRVLRSGQQTLYFTGLKLSKMGPIKEELHIQNSRQLINDFCIQFKIGSRMFFSTPFKLVSSCSQLPKDIRDFVRPPKKSGTKRNRPSQDPSSEEGSPSGSPQHSFTSQDFENAPSNMSTPSNKPQHVNHETASTQQTKTTPDEPRLRQELEVAIQRGDADAASQCAFQLANLNKRRRTE